MTIVNASEDQIRKIFKKHLRWVFWISYSYDSDDHEGFVNCYNIFLSEINFQLRNGNPLAFSLTRGGVRYDIHELEGDILRRVTKIGKKVEKRFWRGGQL